MNDLISRQKSFSCCHENDCISRRAAIDAVGYYSLHSGDKLLFADKPLKELPSAQRWIPCGKCIHADGKHRWCKVLDRTINEDYF